MSAVQRFYSPASPEISFEAALSLLAILAAVVSRSVRIATFSALFLFSLAKDSLRAATYSLISFNYFADCSDFILIYSAFFLLGSTSLKIS